MRLITFTCLVFLLPLCSKAFAQTPPIQHVSTPNWDAFEQLFLQGQCQPEFPVGYIYDLSQQKWLDYEDAVARVPEAKVLMTKQQCQISATAAELAAQLNLTWLSEQGLALLFFDYPETIFETFHKDDPRWTAIYQQRLAALSSLEHISRYRITPSRLGFRPQQ